jgi:hypothetical protein
MFRPNPAARGVGRSAMQWFRSHRGLGAQAALFALAVQFTLAFGHFHVENANAAAPAAAAALNVVNDGLNSRAPPDQDRHPADGWCAICATIHLTGSAQVAAPPALLLPVTYGMTKLSLWSETAADDPRCFELRSRGPPQT